MSRSLGSRTLVALAAIPLLVLLVLLLQRHQQSASSADSIPLHLGSNRVVLERGEYEIWLETEARPDVLPTPDAFDFELGPIEDALGRIQSVSVSAGLPASETGGFLWKLAEIDVRQGGEFELAAEQVGGAPPGQLLLLER